MRSLRIFFVVMLAFVLASIAGSTALARPGFSLNGSQAIADVAVLSSSPTANFNTAELAVQATCSGTSVTPPVAYSFMRFDVTGASSQTSWVVQVVGAFIDPTNGVVGLYKVDTDNGGDTTLDQWDETALTWNDSGPQRTEIENETNLLATATASGTGLLTFTLTGTAAQYVNNQIPPTGDGRVSVGMRLRSCPSYDPPQLHDYTFCDKTVTPFPGFDRSVSCQSVGGGTPLSADLESFEVEVQGRQVVLIWRTASEISNEGFNLYRSEAEDGEYVKINGALIPAQGNPSTGASYSFTDTDVKPGRTYYYKLEDVDTSGVSTFHGPVSATVRGKGR